MTSKPHSRDDRESLLAETREAGDWAYHIELLEEKYAELEEQLEALRKAAVDAEALLTQGTGDEHCAYALGTLRRALSNPATEPEDDGA